MGSVLIQKDQESGVKAENSFIGAIPENLNFGVLIWYTNENRLLLSDGFCKMIGLSKDVYQTFDLFIEYIHPDDLNTFVEILEIMLHGSHPRWFTFKIVRPDKSILVLQSYIEVMRAEFVGIYDITCICFEVSE